ncbi:MAG: hypothetical protein U9O89_03675 [Thermoproteota archaeon]|nr:hypothetical protein [Thermoproteota archaeon]
MADKRCFSERTEKILRKNAWKLKRKEETENCERELMKECQICNDGKTYSWSKLLEHIVQRHQSEIRAQRGRLFAPGIDIKCVNCQLPVRTDNNICPHCGYNLKRWKDKYVASCIAELWPSVNNKS